MLELLMVVAAVLLLAGVSLAVVLVPPLTLLFSSLGLVGLGFIVGLPFGLVYHLRLRRELCAVGPLPARWYVNPFAHHALLPEDAQERIRPYWLAGGFGFSLIVLGMALAVVVLMTRR